MLRVLAVAVQLTVDADVPGLAAQRQILFSYKPEPDDPLVAALLDKNLELVRARMAANPQTDEIG